MTLFVLLLAVQVAGAINPLTWYPFQTNSSVGPSCRALHTFTLATFHANISITSNSTSVDCFNAALFGGFLLSEVAFNGQLSFTNETWVLQTSVSIVVSS